MAGLKNTRQLIDAYDAGQTKLTSWRKAPTQTTAANVWFDLSMSPGNPTPNYYIGTPGVFTPMSRNTHGGIDHGANVTPKQKMLKQLMALTSTATAAPTPLILYDNCGFYPFIDESVTDWQELDNTEGPTRWLEDPAVTLGPELAVNGTNITGTTGWVATFQCTIANNAGAIEATATNTNPYFGQYVTVEVGKTYLVEFRARSTTVTGFTEARFGNATGAGQPQYGTVQLGAASSTVFSSYGLTRTYLVTATTTTLNFQIQGTATIGDTISCEYLSVKELVGYASYSGTRKGFQMMPVVVASQGSSSPYVSFRYTNQDGIPNRYTPPAFMTTQSVNGTCLFPGFGNGGPFVSLDKGDTGVRSVEAVLMLGAEVGLFALSLVKPIASHYIHDITAPAERDFFLDFPSMPVIPDDAYLNLVAYPSGTLASSQILGLAEFVWN